MHSAADLCRKDTAAAPSGDRHRAKVGRKRGAARDAVILDAALTVLAEQGYEGMTAMIRPLNDRQQQVRIQAMAGLLSLAKADQRLPQQSRDVTERMSCPQAAGRVPRRSRAVCPRPPGR